MRIGLVLIALITAFSTQAQTKNVTHEQQVWLGYLNQTRISKKWGVWLDVHLRTKEDFFDDLSIFMVRPGITYYLNDATKLSAGYAFINIYPADSRKISQPEHRPWQQIQWHTKYGRIKTMQWVRLEERFRRNYLNDSVLASGYGFNYRLRYNLLLQLPLDKRDGKPGSFSFVLNDEVHINFGKQIVYNTFDQNRFFAGLGYQVNASDNIQFGYMNMFQQLASGSRYRSVHTARVSYFHNLDLRKSNNN